MGQLAIAMVEPICADRDGVGYNYFPPGYMDNTSCLYRVSLPGYYIGRLSAWLSGTVQGVLPQLMLIVLTALLPVILRIVTGWQVLEWTR